MSDPTDLDLLRRTHNLTYILPWAKGIVAPEAGEEEGYCLVGMLGLAHGISVQGMLDCGDYGDLVPPAIAWLLRQIITEQYPQWGFPIEDLTISDTDILWSWNDRAAESVEAVQRIIEKAIVKLEEQV